MLRAFGYDTGGCVVSAKWGGARHTTIAAAGRGFFYVSILGSLSVPSIYSSGRRSWFVTPWHSNISGMLWLILRSLVSAFKTRRVLALESLALRQQIAVLSGSVKRPRLSNFDRGLWVLLVEGLGTDTRHRESGNGRVLEPLRFQTILDVEKPETSGGHLPGFTAN